MDVIHSLSHGFSLVLLPINLLYCFIGCLIGTLVGVLPGIGPAAAIAMLLPITFPINATGAIIMLAGILYGAQYGGSTTAILVNIPGETSSVMTCLDGYQMAKQGRAGPALGIAAFGSLIAGTLSLILLMFLAPFLAEIALKFGPPEYCTLIIMSLSLISYLVRSSLIKALMMACLGLLLALIGPDPVTAKMRFIYNTNILRSGLNIPPVLMGLFGISEVLSSVGSIENRTVLKTKICDLLPSLQDWKDSLASILRGTGLGFFLGILPGIGLTIPTFASYALERKLSKHPKKFGTGMIAGVAGPEASNNAAAQGTFVPMLSLGIPPTATMALLLGALIMHGIQPGPLLIQEKPDLFWGLICSMYLGNIFLVTLNLPLIFLWVQVLRVPYAYLFPAILLFCMIGVYSLNNQVGDIAILLVFGGVGYLLKYFRYEFTPLIIGFVLGNILESSFRQSMIMSHGSFLIFVNRPIACIFLLVSVFVMGSRLFGNIFFKLQKTIR